ncbi:MAG: polysaccharide deacetylase family protein, partial [Candidatus Bathyarchaeota archaeon]
MEKKKVLLTFDVEGKAPKEDIFDAPSHASLRLVLDLLEEKCLKGIFFLPASVAKHIGRHPDLVDKLSEHRIGYHGSSHSVKPRIIEYVDVPNYEKALQMSLHRETSQINLETGGIEGEGGILALREIFPRRQIECFRAPFLVWSPPHLEALRNLGVNYDFSSSVACLHFPVSFKGITFYPSPVHVDDLDAMFFYREDRYSSPKLIERLLLRSAFSVLNMHPSSLTKNTLGIRTKIATSLLHLLFDRIRFLQKCGLIEVTTSLNQDCQALRLDKVNIKKIYWQSVRN